MNGTDRRTSILTFPTPTTSPHWTSEQGEREFKKLLLQGVRELLDNDEREFGQIVIAVCYSRHDVSVKEKLIPLASRLYPHGCQCCHEKITNPHPRELFECMECGDRHEKYEALKARIPEDHPMKIKMHDALFRWKSERSTDPITVEVRDAGGPIKKATEAEMKELDIWPWGRGGVA